MGKTDPTIGDVLSRLDRDTILGHILGAEFISVLLVSREGKVVFANEACCRMIGLERADLVTRNIDELVHPDDREAGRGIPR